MAALPPLAAAFTLPATELSCSPCRWWRLLNVAAADAASEADTEVGSLCMEEAVWRAARFWAQVVVPAPPVLCPGACGGGVEVEGVEPMPKPGTDIPFDERLFMADWLR